MKRSIKELTTYITGGSVLSFQDHLVQQKYPPVYEQSPNRGAS